jgi:hypothetical protein
MGTYRFTKGKGLEKLGTDTNQKKRKEKGAVEASKAMWKTYGDTMKKVQSVCCTYPSGDGSRCAGGNCCCEDDYICDKCRNKEK